MAKRELRRLEAYFNNRRFVIEEELFYPSGGGVLVWAYLLVFDGDTCTEDHLQDDVDMCKRYALDICQVPKEIWVELPSVFEEESSYEQYE
jgi:hypothetical protein